MDKSLHPTTKYPPSWRLTCRKIVEVYISVQEEKTAQSFGATRLWNAIFDACADKDPEFPKAELEAWLKRQHLENWLKKGNEPRDGAFQFIDRFVRRLLVGEFGTHVRELLKTEQIERTSKGLADIFEIWQADGGNQIGKPFYENVTMASKVAPNSNYRCFLRITGISNRVVCADVIIVPINMNDREKEMDRASWYVKHANLWQAYFALIDVANSLQDYDSFRPVRGVLYVTRTDIKRECTRNTSIKDANMFCFNTFEKELQVTLGGDSFEGHLTPGTRRKHSSFLARFTPISSKDIDRAFDACGHGFI
ncbi:hypothetical protein [Salipiger abyssi]|uniref:hypothetical protein n=1 Tax=Salipiger abyssi TaxID=1250539 RepID=UPI001A8D3ECA|nr:hypothetical protein [Salipiger abyssi]MBN9888521.1 hypothetical protein [Salipiger abyssi]